MSTYGPKPLTIESYVEWLAPGMVKERTPPPWPPDVFALTASILQRSGAYTALLRKGLSEGDWPSEIESIGNRWRRDFAKGAPGEVAQWWANVRQKKRLPIDRIRDDVELSLDLLRLTTAADEGSGGIGIVNGVGPDYKRFEAAWLDAMDSWNGRTCCRQVPPDRVVVLPKLHTPRSGMTLRSLTHNLALYHPGEVVAQWHNFPNFEDRKDLKLLLLPWPLELEPKAIEASKRSVTMPASFGMFTCNLRDAADITPEVERVLGAAKKVAGEIDAIVFPEGYLTGDEYIQICRATKTIVVAGVSTAARPEQSGTNHAAVAIPSRTYQLTWKQSKHHRWRLDAAQIGQYGLPLDTGRDWWEDIHIEPRRINFLSMNGWLTLAVLVCEDLARLDPVADLVRSVGPNLVVCLLLDGPQLPTRWPARYATVLADDPGSSVLTLTSAGMARISRPPKTKRAPPSKTVIALWKDAKHAPVPIEMKADSAGVVLELQREYFEEWSADGRSDGRSTAYLICNGYKQVRKGR